MPLSHVAHVGVGALGRLGAGGPARDHGRRLRPHRGQHIAHKSRIEGGEAHVAALHDLVRDRRQQEAHRRPHTRVSRHQEAVQLKLVGHARGVDRRRPPEGDHGAAAQPLPPLDGVGAGGVRHVLVDHLADAQRSRGRVELQPRPHAAGHGALGSAAVQRDRAACEEVGIDAPQHHVRIGYGGVCAAPPIRRRPRLRPRALGPDVDPVEVVDPRDGAAPRPDLDHLDHGNAHRQSAALLEAVAAGHLEGAGVERLASVDHAQLGGGAAHVKGEDIAQRELASEVARQDRTPGRTGLHQADRRGDGGLEGGEAAARGHEQEWARQAGFAQRLRKAGQVACHERLHVGVGARRGDAFVLADLGADVGGEGNREVGALGGQDFGDALLVGGVRVAVNEANGDGFDAVLVEYREDGVDRLLVEGDENAAAVVESLRDGQPQVPRDQRRGPVDPDVVLLEAVLVGHLEGIAVPRGRDQRRACALPLDDGVGGQRGAVNDEAYGPGWDGRRLEDLVDAPQHTLLGGRLGREHLGRDQAVFDLERHIGEGAADVDGETGAACRRPIRAGALSHRLAAAPCS